MVTGGDAVHVLTYHRAKGLEWPVVVATEFHYTWGSRIREVRSRPGSGPLDIDDLSQDAAFASTPATCARLEDSVYRGQGYWGAVQTMTRRVLVDGNNVMGSRPDGWWRNRAQSAQRLVADIVPMARCLGGTWTVVFDGTEPPLTPPQGRVSVVHTGHGRRDGADDRIVELVGALPDPAMALVYTSDSELRARVHALGAPGCGRTDAAR